MEVETSWVEPSIQIVASTASDLGELGVSNKRWWLFAIVVLFSLIWHAAMFLPRINWGSASPSHRFEVQQVDPAKLDAIRKSWKNQEKQLLLNKDKSPPTKTDAPDDARYMSDRNIRVEKEQKARDTAILPRPKSSRSHPSPPRPPKANDALPSQNLPRLGNLGVPLKLTAKSPKAREQREQREQKESKQIEGGDQALLEKNLPEGGENLLNAQESVYYSFYARLYEAIGPIWQSRVNEVPSHRQILPGEYSTSVDVVFDRDGKLLEVRQLQSSGISEFDQAVNSSWKKIGHVQNPPAALLNQDGEVHVGWTFSVHVGQGFNLQYLPPERIN